MSKVVKVSRISDGKRMPWKNGLGVTTEMAIYPEGSSLEKGDFLWRLSSASVQADNQFSQFVGYDRKLVILKGDGLVLNGKSIKPNEVFSFEGEEKIECKVLGKTVEDLGIISHRGLCDCEMSIITIDRETNWALSGNVHFIFPLEAPVLCNQVTIDVGEFVQLEHLNEAKLGCFSGNPSRVLIASICIRAYSRV